MSCSLARLYKLQLSEDNRKVKEMKYEKIETQSGMPFLTKDAIQKQNVKIVTIETEPIMVDVTFKNKDGSTKTTKKYECICSTNVIDPPKVKWQMNPTTSNFLAEKHGEETKNWIGKEIKLTIKKAGSAEPGIYPVDCSLEKVIA